MQARLISRASTLTLLAATFAPVGRANAGGDLEVGDIPGGARRRPIERVHYDVDSGGAQLARGATYKASFDTDGATYVPFLGSKAPRNCPVTFRLESVSAGGTPIPFDSAASPVRSGDTVDFDRGSLVERYELNLDSIEQVLVVAYSELFGSSTNDWDVYVSTFGLVGNTIEAIEPHQNLAYTAVADFAPQISAARGSSSSRFLAAWTQFPGGGADIHAGIYERPSTVAYCFPGINGVQPCPCGNPPASGGGCNNSSATGGAVLMASGTPSLAADTLAFTQYFERPTALSIFLQGNSDIIFGAAFGEGVRCAGGTLKRLFLHNASGGVVSGPVGSDPSVSARSAATGDPIPAGGTRFYQVYYRDPNLAPCAETFNVGNGIKVLWAP